MNKKSIATILCLLGVAGIYWLVQAGEIEPPGPPVTTEHNLQAIYDKVDEGRGAGQYAIPKTGQTVGHAPYDDGWYKSGVSVETRFTAGTLGTVKDNLTGLIWLQNANCFSPRKWAVALQLANTLAHGSCGLSDGSVAGDWRLPNVKELQSLMDYSRRYPALPIGHPFTGITNDDYWSSTTVNRSKARAWYVDLREANLSHWPKDDSNYVWPVKGGQ